MTGRPPRSPLFPTPTPSRSAQPAGNATALTITKAHLTVTADPQSRAYGAANPTFTATLGGFQNGETDAGLRTASALTGAASFTTTAPSSSNPTAAASYVTTRALTTMNQDNYAFTLF